MNDRGDNRLARELREAYGRNLPGEEFDLAVMDRTLADSGGEHEVSLDAPGGRRWWPLFAAAAAVLLLLGAWQFSGQSPPQAPPFSRAPEPAAPGNERIVVRIAADGKTSVGGTVLTEEQLKQYLALRARECRADSGEPQEPYVHIEGDPKTAPGQLQRFLQLCADPEVRIFKFQFSSGEVVEVGPRTNPDPREEQRPLEPQDRTSWHTLVLTRLVGETSTLVNLDRRELGRAPAAFSLLEKALAGNSITVGEIDAGARVPRHEVVRAIDLLMQAGVRQISLIGAPNPGAARQHPVVTVSLHLLDGRTSLTIGGTGKHHPIEEGLIALAAHLDEVPASEVGLQAIVEAGVYIDQKITERVLAILQEHGFGRVTIIR